MIIKLFRENSPEAPFSTKSDVEDAIEKIAEAAGSEDHTDLAQLVCDVEQMRRTILIARSMFLHEDLTTALFLANKVSDEQFELSEDFRKLIDRFNEGTRKILKGEHSH